MIATQAVRSPAARSPAGRPPAGRPAAGQPAAARHIEEIVSERPHLRRVALALTRHDADAEDLVQETMFRAYRAAERLRPASCIRAWLVTILRREFLSSLRRRNRAGIRPRTDVGPAADEDLRRAPESVGADASDFASIEEQLDERLRRAVSRVPAVYRVPLCRHALEGLTYHELALQLGVPRGTVMSRIFRARARVKSALSETGYRYGRGA